MRLTEERVVPKLMNPKNGMLREHISRYKFAANFARGLVLDIACGVGYGAGILVDESPCIHQFLGVDIDEKSIVYARKHYSGTNISFLVEDALSASLSDKIGLFETIISFETIEHIEQDQMFVENLYKLLNLGGTLIISTPFGRGRGIPCSNPFHIHQYKEEEFTDLLKCFGSVEMYYQIDEVIERRVEGKKYYLMVAVCKHQGNEDIRKDRQKNQLKY